MECELPLNHVYRELSLFTGFGIIEEEHSHLPSGKATRQMMAQGNPWICAVSTGMRFSGASIAGFKGLGLWSEGSYSLVAEITLERMGLRKIWLDLRYNKT